jgi:hypothetical protein
MQEENFVMSATLPPASDSEARPPDPSDICGCPLPPPVVLAAEAVVEVVPRLATPGAAEGPPQPAARNASPKRVAAKATRPTMRLAPDGVARPPRISMHKR